MWAAARAAWPSRSTGDASQRGCAAWTTRPHTLNTPSTAIRIRKFQFLLEPMFEEDTEAREHFGLELEKIMDILHIESGDGLLSYSLN